MRRHCPRLTVLIVEPRFRIVCEDCAGEIEPDRSLRRCPSCTGKLTFTYSLDGLVWPAPGSGMWAYRQLLPLVDPANEVSMGEGDTPLVPAHGDWGCRLYWKNEGLNPTGSHKDRALSLAVSRAREVKAPRVVIASTGSAALAAAAYCARAGLPCVVIVPRGTPSERLAPIALLGAHLVELQGTFVQIERLLDTLEHDPSWYDATTKRIANPFQAEAPKDDCLRDRRAAGASARLARRPRRGRRHHLRHLARLPGPCSDRTHDPDTTPGRRPARPVQHPGDRAGAGSPHSRGARFDRDGRGRGHRPAESQARRPAGRARCPPGPPELRGFRHLRHGRGRLASRRGGSGARRASSASHPRRPAPRPSRRSPAPGGSAPRTPWSAS